jgi:SH3-like domain-containing protein
MENHIEKVRKKLGIDTRLCVFELYGDVLKVSDEKIADKVLEELRQINPRLKIKLLPDETCSEFKFGVCNVGTASVFKEPSMKSEQVTQAILGETFDTLEIFNDDWVRIRLHFDGYIGWIYRSQVVLMKQEEFSKYTDKVKVQFEKNFGFVREKPDAESISVRDVVICSVLNVLRARNKWFMVELPDGEVGWIRKNEVRRFLAIDKRNVNDIIQTAKRFLGVSYLWGGKTPKGFDCSGFVQTVFRINGVRLPCDADMQWSVGDDLGMDFSKFKKGDLLFFSSDGERVTHVGIYLGKDKKVIHSSGFVRINSLDRKSVDYSERLERTFIGAKRVLI